MNEPEKAVQLLFPRKMRKEHFSNWNSQEKKELILVLIGLMVRIFIRRRVIDEGRFRILAVPLPRIVGVRLIFKSFR